MAGDKVGVGEGEEEEEVEEAKVMAKDVFLGVEIATREVVIVMAIVIVVGDKVRIREEEAMVMAKDVVDGVETTQMKKGELVLKFIKIVFDNIDFELWNMCSN